MDEFKPEDELKADSSDRRPARARRPASTPKVPVSRQHLMMGVGILVLLLLVIGLGSALKGPGETTSSAPQTAGSNAGEKAIDLSGSSSMSQSRGETPAPAASAENAAAPGAPQDIAMPPIASSPTDAHAQPVVEDQQRVDLPGDLNTALSNSPDAMANVTPPSTHAGLPTAPATVSAASGKSESLQPVKKNETAAHASAAPKQTAAKSPGRTPTREAPVRDGKTASSKPSGTAAAGGSRAGVPSGNYTLQLSSASRADTLNAWAKKQNLSGYHVYKTTRNGQPWYVLVSGAYATPAEARRAAAALPADVRAQSPWVKPVSQVKKELQ
ncbi:SPOR domain-containing protein [Pantoea sp. 1.19]|uniref:SPOR domain-containing protein n=1 Tax=Pantoea sp. 1.19 TaxID=1925589 RepID=UPI000948AE5F|nr:SPOR domain-containing protein [Pantoea sp. 1.19]